MEEKVRNCSKLGISFKVNSIKQYVFGDTVDELIDNLIKLKSYEFITSFISDFPNLKDAQLKKLDNAMLDCKDIKDLSNYAITRRVLSNTKKVEDAFVSLCRKPEDCRYIAMFAKYVTGANIVKLQNCILNCHVDSSSMVYFLRDFPAADPYKFKQAIMDSKNIISIIELYRICPGFTVTEINELQEMVISSNSACAIYKFARYVDDSNIDKLRNAINLLANHNNYYQHYWIQQFQAEYGEHKKFHFFSRKK